MPKPCNKAKTSIKMRSGVITAKKWYWFLRDLKVNKLFNQIKKLHY